MAATYGAQAVNKKIVNSIRCLLFIRIRFANIIFPLTRLGKLIKNCARMQSGAIVLFTPCSLHRNGTPVPDADVGLFVYGRTINPSIVPEDSKVARLTRRRMVIFPLAPSNRPVPPVMARVSTIEITPGVPVGVPWPVPFARRVDPSAATNVAELVAERAGTVSSA
jgi:hypothetical protein